MARKSLFLKLLLVFIFAFSCYADAGMLIGSGAVGAGGDSCTGGLLAGIHFEQDDVTGGTPAGCYIMHDSDTTLAYNSAAVLNTDDESDGSKSLDAPTQYDRAELPINQNFPTSEGTIEVDYYMDTCAVGDGPVTLYYDGSDLISIRTYDSCTNGSIDMRLVYWTSGTTDGNVICNLNGSTGQWYRIKAEWKNGTGNDLKITIWDLDASSPREINSQQCTTTDDDDWDVVGNTPTVVRMGNTVNGTMNTHTDRLYIRSDSSL